MDAIVVTSNAKDAKRWLQKIAYEQIPFATSKALNGTAERATKQTRRDQAKRYKRPAPGVARGIGYKKSHKRQKPHIEARVFTRDHFQVLQESGGVKRPGGKDRKGKRGGSDHLAVPARGMGKVTPSKRPRPMIQKGKAVIAGKAIIRTKAKRRYKGRKDGRMRLFSLVKRAHIKPAKPTMRDSIEGTARRVYRREFLVEYQRAIRSAKPRVRG